MNTKFVVTIGKTDYACNADGCGLFISPAASDLNEWRQVYGTCDTPVFASAAQVRDWAAKHHDSPYDDE